MKDSLNQLVKLIIESIEINVDKFEVYGENDTLPKILKTLNSNPII